MEPEVGCRRALLPFLAPKRHTPRLLRTRSSFRVQPVLVEAGILRTDQSSLTPPPHHQSRITLYQIGVDGPGPELDLLTAAPHGWKSLLELRLLDIPFTPKRITLVQLRDDMPGIFGPDRVTVPVSETRRWNDTGEHC